MKRRSKIYFQDIEEPVPVRVKRKIISAGHLVGTTPDQLGEERKLVNDLLFGANEFDALCIKLQKLVLKENPDAELTCTQVSACETVGDCITLVETTIKA